MDVELHVCGRGIALGDDLVAFVVDTDLWVNVKGLLDAERCVVH